MSHVVTKNACLRFELQLAQVSDVTQIRLLRVNVGREPKTRLHLLSPTVEMEEQTADFAQEFAADEFKVVVGAVEVTIVDEHHLRKSVRQVLHVDEHAHGVADTL